MKNGEIVEFLIYLRDGHTLSSSEDAAVCAACNIIDKLPRMMDEEEAKAYITEKQSKDGYGTWISTKDRLPDAPGHYLICTNINYWHGGCMDKNEERKHRQKCGTPEGYEGTTMSVLDCYLDPTQDWNRVCNSHVTHWMKLPDPPKGE